MKKIAHRLLMAGGAISAGISVTFFSLYYSLCWQHRERFNDVGRYVDESDLVVYQDQNGVLIVPAIAFALLTLALFVARSLLGRTLVCCAK